MLLGGLSAGALAGCDLGNQPPPLTDSCVYTNNYFVPGAGYYHAPFRAWYPLPYNHFDPQSRRYFNGGQWTDAPHESITNISPPTLAAAQSSEAQRTDISRGGFGRSSSSHWISS